MKQFQILSKSKIVGTSNVLQQRFLSYAARKNVRIAHAAVGKEHEHLFRWVVFVFLLYISPFDFYFFCMKKQQHSEDCLKFVRSVAGEMQPRWRAGKAYRNLDGMNLTPNTPSSLACPRVQCWHNGRIGGQRMLRHPLHFFFATILLGSVKISRGKVLQLFPSYRNVGWKSLAPLGIKRWWLMRWILVSYSWFVVL